MVEAHSKDMELLIESEKTFLKAHAMYITGKTEDAEDLFQDTIMKACKGFTSFACDTNFRAWAKKIMMNTHLNKMRRKILNTLPYEDTYYDRDNVILKDLPQVTYMDDPENVFFHNHISDEIMWHFYALPEEYRSVFSLFHFNGYTYAEISSAVNIPVGTVKSRIHRARQCLKERIRSEHEAGNTKQ